MKKNILNRLNCLVMLCLLTGCFHESPDPLAPGGMVDPTKVNVEVNVSLDFTIDPFVTQSRAGSDFYRRFIVDLYRKDDLLRPAERKVIIIDEVRTKEEAFRLPINLNVQPLDYTMVVWTDYIKVGTGEDYFYNTTALTDIYSLEPYQGNCAYRDALYGTALLNLSEYCNEWNKKIQVSIDLERAASPIRIIATDYEHFVEKHGKKVAEKATVTFTYSFYVPMGFNALTGLPMRSQMGTSFVVPLSMAERLEEGLQIATDFIFVGEEGTNAIVTLDIKDEGGNLLNQVKNMQVPYRKGYLTTLKNNFLTSEQSSGIEVDVELDEDINVDID